MLGIVVVLIYVCALSNNVFNLNEIFPIRYSCGPVNNGDMGCALV